MGRKGWTGEERRTSQQVPWLHGPRAFFRAGTQAQAHVSASACVLVSESACMLACVHECT